MKKWIFLLLLLLTLGYKMNTQAEETGIRSKGRIVFEEGNIILDAKDIEFLKGELNQLFQECRKEVGNV